MDFNVSNKFSVGDMYLDTEQLKTGYKNIIYVVTRELDDYDDMEIKWLSGDLGYIDEGSLQYLTKNDVRIDDNKLIRILYGLI